MVRANSLLYAIYVCLLIGVLIGALLMLSNLYSQLNVYYATYEQLYTNNLSTVNYAFGNQLIPEEEALHDDNTGIQSNFTTKKHGLHTILLTQSFTQKDTVKSAHFVGKVTTRKEALYVSNYRQPLNVSGNVSVIGDSFLAYKDVKQIHIENKPNIITFQGRKEISEVQLPQLSVDYFKLFENTNTTRTTFEQLEPLNDSLYFNSFFNETIEIVVSNPFLNHKIAKGNFIISAKDSIVIGKNAQLEDVIIKAPKVRIESGFEGTIQILASEQIYVGKDVTLNYPSALCLYNNTSNKKATVFLDEAVAIEGLILCFGNDIKHLSNNVIQTSKNNLILGIIYSSGEISLNGTVKGGVYASKLIHRTNSANYSNCLANVNIDVTKKPSFFIDFPLFNTNDQRYGIIKKIL